MMMSKASATIRATLMLLLLEYSQCIENITVDPPEDIVILDHDHLGLLQIKWSPPASLFNVTECQKRFQLEYFNTYQNRWNAVRTPLRTYSAQFNLTEEVRVRVYTLLRGPCTNGSEIKSKRFTELVEPPASTGLVGTMVQNFVCVFHKMEYMECNWERSLEQPADSLNNLYFWHGELERTKECPEYIISNGVRIGCNFTGNSLPDFTDINICVNGTSSQGKLRPIYFSLQIQNHVKPATTEKIHLLAAPDGLKWECPVGRVPRNCLQWEVEHSQDGSNGRPLLKTLTSETQLPLNDTGKGCFRVRSRLQKYCAKDGFWSDWSEWRCHPDEGVIETMHAKSGWDEIAVSAHVAVVIITMLILALCVWAVFRVLSSRQGKTIYPLSGQEVCSSRGGTLK
ncbi:interleukin-13 receptor subunit alpha-2 isoform 2-T2 [Polymixia lowei]